MLNFFEHFDTSKIIMSSTVKNNTISSSGSSSSASTSVVIPNNQNSTPTSNTTPAFYFNTQALNVTNIIQSPQPSHNSNAVMTTPTVTPAVANISSATATNVTINNSTNSNIHEEKVYKKEKQILVEFDTKTKGKFSFCLLFF